ncbi:cyclin-C [Coniochaeta ligniaria NRRL 30616]|uniref:RNA polymerase II holoenzyme cyclin-like subunit n=1 Tax=Coniochaeta ligniaria NRRL 30616 TaxID=1408157 RepID=A0A1J7J9C4_9PEZI|nr:cyclin-C [Coniochaeta ligniaria NRRL 30616]
MAANYWESTQRKHWQFTKDQLATMRQKLEDEDPQLVHMFPLQQLRHLNIYFNQQINRLGKRLGVRQQAIATAQMYLKRFYTRVEIRRTNPYLVLATAVYLACKMEECPQHIRLVVSEARSLWPADFVGLDTSKLGECEFFLISEMNSQLIVHQPYRTLTMLQGEFALSPEEVALAWSVVNDTYMTDLPLLYPPHVIACTAVLLAVVLRPSGNNPAGGQGGTNTTNPQAGFAAAAAALSQARAAGNTTPLGTPLSSQGSSQPDGSQPERKAGAGAAAATPDARVGKVQRFAAWLGESGIDIEAMVDSTQELISFYECHEQYNDKLTREQINRYVKARGLDK